ncbi:MAG TPA: ROK family protein [Bacteroidota bacterium]|nr:ROK family protein [Bacteroidota bacterium]
MAHARNTLAVGVDLGGTTVKTGLVTPGGQITYTNRLSSRADEGPAAVIGQIVDSVQDVMKHADGAPLAGIGIGSPGVVDNLGFVKAPPNLAGWNQVPLAKELGKTFRNVPISVENDANCAAIAESKFGAGKDHPDFLFIIWGTGIGGGIILDRKLFRGTSGGAGEVGHISIDYDGPLCGCGNRGCVEAFIGQKYLSQRTAEKLKAHPTSLILELVGGDYSKIEPVFISRAAEAGDELARDILIEAGTFLGVAVGAVMNTMDMRVSIIGGGVSAAGALVIKATEDSVRAHVLKPLQKDIRVLQSTLGNDAGILGAAGLVL